MDRIRVSEGLQLQMDRLQKSGSFSVNDKQKKELQRILVSLGYTAYNNFRCGVCTRDAMNWLLAFQMRFKDTPKLQMNMVKSLDELTWHELKAHAKAKGVKTYGKNREQITKELES